MTGKVNFYVDLDSNRDHELIWTSKQYNDYYKAKNCTKKFNMKASRKVTPSIIWSLVGKVVHIVWLFFQINIFWQRYEQDNLFLIFASSTWDSDDGKKRIRRVKFWETAILSECCFVQPSPLHWAYIYLLTQKKT